MLQNHTWIKYPLKVQDRPIGFIVTEGEKFTEIVSDSTLQLTLRNYHLSNFVSSSKEKQPQLSKKAI